MVLFYLILHSGLNLIMEEMETSNSQNRHSNSRKPQNRWPT
nr:MAG TPA: hypothetical protein [Bacteriophage sp.]